MTNLDIPEADHLIAAIDAAEPDQLTACSTWRVHELVAHLAAGITEMVRNLDAYVSHGPDAVPATRGLEEREAPFRAMPLTDLRDTLIDGLGRQADLLATILGHDPAAVTVFAGQQMPVAAFISHSRSELALHRWDVVGSDETSLELLASPVLTEHAVTAMGAVLGRGHSTLHQPMNIALESPGQPTVLITATGLQFTDTNDGEAVRVIAANNAARLLLLWGRAATPPGEIRVLGEGNVVEQVRRVLPGF